MRRLTAVAAACLTIAASAQPGSAHAADFDPGTPPEAGLTNQEAIVAFGGAVMDCLQSRMGGTMIKDLGDRAAIKVQPATLADRTWTPSWTPATAPAWVTSKLGHWMNITEPSPERCEVNATNLPVERTFQAVIYGFAKVFPDFKPVPVKPGYDPIVYQLESVSGGVRYIVHMEGAEPGTPLHALRFSLLYAYVLRSPASASSPGGAGPVR